MEVSSVDRVRRAMPRARPDVLVTGAAGFIGRQLVAALRAAGERVVGLDVRPGADVRGDVCDDAVLAALVPEGGRVFHLASVVGIVEVLRRPSETLRTSVVGTRALCRVAAERGARVVLTSSSEVYGEGGGARLSEDHELPDCYCAWPRSSYPDGKRLAEAMVRDLPGGRVARLFNVSGPGQSAAGGMVLPTFVSHALAGLPLPVVEDGTDVRCFQHVEDVVAGLRRLAAARVPSGFVVNLGGDEAIDVQSLAARVGLVTGRAIRLRRVTPEERYGGETTRCRHRVPDLTRARGVLGHVARRSLDEVIAGLARVNERTAVLTP